MLIASAVPNVDVVCDGSTADHRKVAKEMAK